MLRKYKPGDTKDIYEIFFHPEVNPYMNVYGLSFSSFEKYWKGRLGREKIYVWEEDKKVVAMLCVRQGGGRCAGTFRMGSFAVHPDWQERGIGKKIIGEILNLLKSQNAIRVELMAEADNDKAIAFYKNLGFEEEGRLRKYFNREGKLIDEIVMSVLFR